MGIYTSRYSNKELEDSKYYCVGISIGTPKFKLAYRLENQCYSLAPKGYMLRMGLEDFKKAFEAGADAALAASVFHFGKIPIPDLKKYLAKEGIPIRPAE